MCGERSNCNQIVIPIPGSSPRVRGTGRLWLVRRADLRFIPACAGNGGPRGPGGPSGPVHPRVCGERFSRQWNTRLSLGSSPRVRGTDWQRGGRGRQSRFIPACAGNGIGSGPSRGGSTVHPRVCGERGGRPGPGHRDVGSSPRVRGTGHAGCWRRGAYRFIPACAGNGLPPSCSMTSWTVHPRVCGERAIVAVPSSLPGGSSPRVRGTGVSHCYPLCVVRFIPACAGNGGARPRYNRRPPVHPRVCGERPRMNTGPATACGSSPRVRGTGHSPIPPTIVRRFIPACAGNGNRLLAGLEGGAGSSPRVRGTGCQASNFSVIHRFIPACAGNGKAPTTKAAFDAGSSPRVRGTGLPEIQVLVRAWFIPACAGNGSPGRGRPRASPVHPRVCGERYASTPTFSRISGSSPRVRGTEPMIPTLKLGIRFIPACAGNGHSF